MVRGCLVAERDAEEPFMDYSLEDEALVQMEAELRDDEVCMDCGALMSEHRVSPPFCRPEPRDSGLLGAAGEEGSEVRMSAFERRQESKRRLHDPATADNMEVRLSIVRRMEAGEITLE